MSTHKETIMFTIDVPDEYTADLDGKGNGEFRPWEVGESFLTSIGAVCKYTHCGSKGDSRIILKPKPHPWPECPEKLKGKGWRLRRNKHTKDTFLESKAAPALPVIFLERSGKQTLICEDLGIDPSTIPTNIPPEGIEL